MELLILLNIMILSYLLLMCYQIMTLPAHVTYDSRHHFVSHFYMLLFLIIGIDAHAFYSTLLPLSFAIVNILVHLIKENRRLLSSNYWTPDIKEDL